MTYRGHIQNGTVVLDELVPLPEGTLVEVDVRAPAARTLLERFAGLVGACPELPPDMAQNHDHYLHGREKR